MVEVDRYAECEDCEGDGCLTCDDTGWICTECGESEYLCERAGYCGDDSE